MGVFAVVASPVGWFNYQFPGPRAVQFSDRGGLVYEGIAPAVSPFPDALSPAARSGILRDGVAFCLTRRNGMALRRFFPVVVVTVARTE
jgi:hypothetical protein